jgi:hypothetical protein
MVRSASHRENRTNRSTKPVEDSIAKINAEVAVGEDLAFQKKWWVFERWVWIVFTLILLLDLSGAPGHGRQRSLGHQLRHRHTHGGSGAPCYFVAQIEIAALRIDLDGTPLVLVSGIP